MLANGATLGYKEKTGSTFTDLDGIKEIPDMGVEPEKVDNTGLNDKNKQSEMGIGDPGDMKYKFKYANSSAASPYRKMRDYAADKTELAFQEKLADGTITEYNGIPSVKRTGGGVNGVVDFELTIAVTSDLKFTDPA